MRILVLKINSYHIIFPLVLLFAGKIACMQLAGKIACMQRAHCTKTHIVSNHVAKTLKPTHFATNSTPGPLQKLQAKLNEAEANRLEFGTEAKLWKNRMKECAKIGCSHQCDEKLKENCIDMKNFYEKKARSAFHAKAYLKIELARLKCSMRSKASQS